MKMDLWRRFTEEYGLSVIPLVGKKPIEENWTQWATKKRVFHEKDFVGKNAGVVLSSDYIVVDVDRPELFAKSCDENFWDLPDTLTVKTGSQNHHYYYRNVWGTSFRSSSMNKTYGFELMTAPKQMVLPGSVHPGTGGEYVIEKEHPIAPAPDWVKGLLKEKNEGVKPTYLRTNDKYLNNLKVSSRTKELILTDFPKGTRSDKQFSVLCSLVNAGLGVDAMEYVLRHFPIGAKAREQGEQWMNDEIGRAVSKCGERATTALSSKPEDYFFQTEDASRVLSIMAHESIETEWLCEGLIPAKEYGFLAAPGSTGKGLFSLKLAYSIAIGRSLFPGLNVGKRGKVLYCSYEDSASAINSRLSTLTPLRKLMDHAKKRKSYMASKGSWFHIGDVQSQEYLEVMGQSLAAHSEELKALEENLILRGAELTTGTMVSRSAGGFGPTKHYNGLLNYASTLSDLRLIVIDTQAQAAGEAEASNAEVASFNSCMQKLVQVTGATVMVSAHMTKEAAKKGGKRAFSDVSQRGPSALYSAARYQLMMAPLSSGGKYSTKNDNEHTSYVGMKVTKCNYSDHCKEMLVFRKHSERGAESFELASDVQANSELEDWIVAMTRKEDLTYRDMKRVYGKAEGNPFGVTNGPFMLCLDRCIAMGRIRVVTDATTGAQRLRVPGEIAPAA